jgi:hypothetical protein
LPIAPAEQHMALAQIEAYTSSMKATDQSFEETEQKIVPLLSDLLRNYPPQYWLGIIQLRPARAFFLPFDGREHHV